MVITINEFSLSLKSSKKIGTSGVRSVTNSRRLDVMAHSSARCTEVWYAALKLSGQGASQWNEVEETPEPK